MRLVLGTIGAVLLAQSLQAQADSARWHSETGLEIAAIAAVPVGGTAYAAMPVSLRYGFIHPLTPWSAEMRLGLLDSRFRTRGNMVALAGGITVSRRLGQSGADPSFLGTYLFGGATLTKVAMDYDTPSATSRGVHLGIGRRIALGKSASLRPELVIAHDFSAHRDSVRAPATTTLALRIGVGDLLRW